VVSYLRFSASEKLLFVQADRTHVAKNGTQHVGFLKGVLRVDRTYSVPIKTLCVQVKGREKEIGFQAEKAEENSDTNELIAYRNGQIVGRFTLEDIQGWWLEDRQ
jgi:hypothetical protein